MHRRSFIKTGAVATGGMILSTNATGSVTGNTTAPIVIIPKWGEKGTQLKHSWAGLGNIDQMRWIMRRDMQEQLAMCKEEIGLKHVRAIGIFDDPMWVYGKDPANYTNREKRGLKRNNWRVPFYIYDSLLSIGISPMVTTCFIPDEIASTEQVSMDTKVNISPPKDWNQWEGFVKDFVKNMVDHYGIEIVRNWYFEVWNEPNLTSFWMGGKDGYFKMYQIVYNAVKSIDPSLKVGGPSTAHTVWINDILEFGQKNNCTPDYIIGHIYNNDSAVGDPLSPFEGPQGDKENKSPNFVTGIARGARKLLDDASFIGEFHMNEWGLSWYPFAPVRETANEAAFIVKTMKEASQYATYFAYWCISDIYNQVGYGREAFHGNYGMISLDGLRKPNYHAHELLCKLGNQQVAIEGNVTDQFNAFVSKSDKEIQAIVYAFDINYQAGDATHKQNVEFYLPANIKTDSIQLTRIDSQENNIISKWKEMGSPAYLKPLQKDKLLSQNQLKVANEKIKVQQDRKGEKINFSMETPGVVMINAKIK